MQSDNFECCVTEGIFEVLKGGEVIGQMGPGRAFGELAILYGCTRTASIRGIYQRICVLKGVKKEGDYS